MTFLLVLAAAVVVGMMGSMLGVGGGILLVPLLTLVLDVPVRTAIGTSLVCVVVTSSASQIVYVDKGLSNLRLGMTLEVMTTLGALAGGLTALLVSGRVIFGLFAAVLVYLVISMGRTPAERVPAGGGRLSASFVDPASGRHVSYGVRRLPLGLGASFVAGDISGLLGVGGGIIKVPLMNVAMGVPLKASIATSNLMIGVTAATGALLFFIRGYVDPRFAVPTALGVLAGAQLGSRAAGKVPTGVLRIMFQILGTVLAIEMALKAFS